MLDLTRRLPADTWLQRFSVNADQVQLQGQSREAAALITLLQQSPYLEGPALQGAITPDARTGKEQFLIQAKLRNPPPPAAGACPGHRARDAPRTRRARARACRRTGEARCSGCLVRTTAASSRWRSW